MNRDKVIRGLEACNAGDCDHCPYQHIEPRKEFWDDGLPVCQSGKMLEEALELLKEHGIVVLCKDCKFCEYPKSKKEWCKKGHLHGNAENWFCADGERL